MNRYYLTWLLSFLGQSDNTVENFTIKVGSGSTGDRVIKPDRAAWRATLPIMGAK